MAYINFKEENYKLNIQLEKRKKNNDKNYNYILKHKNEMRDYNPDNKYSYKVTKGKFIGKKGVLNEENYHIVSSMDIICANFKDCTFANIKFINCRIIGCRFYNCNFILGGVVFENCIFIMEESLMTPSLNNMSNYSCEFYSCEFYSKFKNSDLSYAIFEDCLIKDTNFENSMMRSVIINKSELNKVKISDCDLSGFKTHRCYLVDFEFDDKYKTKFDEKTFFDKLVEIKKDRDEYEGIYMTYQIIADKFKDNTLNNNFGEYYYLCKKIQFKVLDPIPKLASFFYYISCGYGERPFNAIFLGCFFILIYGLIYLYFGVDINKVYTVYNSHTLPNFNLNKFIHDYHQTISLSSGVFLGVGGYSCEPVKFSLFVSNIEMLTGVVMMGIGIGTIVRKIIR